MNTNDLDFTAFCQGLSERIREKKKQYRYSTGFLAQKTLVSPTTFKKYLKGTTIPSSYAIAVLADLFHMTPNELLGRSNITSRQSDATAQVNYCLTKIASLQKDIEKIRDLFKPV